MRLGQTALSGAGSTSSGRPLSRHGPWTGRPAPVFCSSACEQGWLACGGDRAPARIWDRRGAWPWTWTWPRAKPRPIDGIPRTAGRLGRRLPWVAELAGRFHRHRHDRWNVLGAMAEERRRKKSVAGANTAVVVGACESSCCCHEGRAARHSTRAASLLPSFDCTTAGHRRLVVRLAAGRRLHLGHGTAAAPVITTRDTPQERTFETR